MSITHELLSLAAATAAASWDTDAPAKETWAQRIARVLIERAAGGDIRAIALVLERIDGKAGAEVESSVSEPVEFAPIALRSSPP